MRLRETLLLGVATANEWSSKWNPWNCPSSCKEQLTSFAYDCDSNTPLLEDYLSETCSINDYNSPTTGSAATGQSCFFCPCKNMPFVQCAKDINDIITTYDGQRCYADVGDDICSCSQSFGAPLEPESRCVPGVSCYFDDLKMDDRANYQCLAVSNNLDLVQSKVNFATSCSQNLIGHIEGYLDDPNYYRPTPADPFDEENAATIAGVSRHLTHHVDYHREIFSKRNTEDELNDLPGPLDAQNFWYGLSRSSGVTNDILHTTDNTLQNLRGKVSTAYAALNRLRKIKEEKCPDRVCQCEPGYNWDPVAKECVNCGFGFEWNPETNECVKCEEGYDPANAVCIYCPDYYEWVGVCRKCLEDWDPETRRCVYCPDGQAWDDASKTCYDCPEGWNEITRECEFCYDNNDPEDFWSEAEGKCVYCPPGSEHNYENYGECVRCEEGYDSNTKRCYECPPGYFWNGILCVKCPEGYDEDGCIFCEDGSVWDPQAQECQECPEYWDPVYNECLGSATNLNISWLVMVDKNQLSLGWLPTPDECKLCKDMYGSESYWDPIAEKCVFCPINHELNYETGECERCEEGWNDQTRRCTYCNDGYEWNGIGCIKCPEGWDPITRDCVYCDPYEEWNPTDMLCQPCPEDWDELYGCVPCPDNSFWNPETLECEVVNTDCGPGYEWNGVECVPCPEDWNEIDGCVLCPEGYPWNPIIQECQFAKITNNIETLLVIGGEGDSNQYAQRTDAFIYCANDTNADHVDFDRDVVTNAYQSDLIANSASLRVDYRSELQRLVFGGRFQTKQVRSIFPKGRHGDSRGLRMEPLNVALGEDYTPEAWEIPSSTSPDYNGNSVEEYGKLQHEGITCADYTVCARRNFLIGGEITGSTKSSSILEWNESGFLPGQKNLVYGRANTAAVSGKNHLCNGVFIIAGEGNTELGGSAQFGAVTSTECFDGTTSRVIPEMDIGNIFSGLYQHSAVIVQKDNQSGDDIWVLGGIASARNGGSSSNTDLIFQFRHLDSQWIKAGTLMRRIAGHKSFVTYPRSNGIDDFGDFNIFTVGGEGGIDIPMQRCDQSGYCYKVETETYNNRHDHSILVFRSNEFNLNDLPYYEEHCPDL